MQAGFGGPYLSLCCIAAIRHQPVRRLQSFAEDSEKDMPDLPSAVLKIGECILDKRIHHVSEQHLQRYVTEFDFRYSYRQRKEKINGRWVLTGYSDTQRAEMALKGISNKRLTYRPANSATKSITRNAN
jgi:hypothetical protein